MNKTDFDTFLVLTYGTYSNGEDFTESYHRYVNRLPLEVIRRSVGLIAERMATETPEVDAAIRQALEEYHGQRPV